MDQVNKIIDKIYNFLKSFTLAVILLSLIAIFSAIGSVSNNVVFFQKLGLADVYYSKWFLMLIVLFVINLVLCTLSMIKTTKMLFHPKSPNKVFQTKDTQKTIERLVGHLKAKRLYIKQNDNLVAAYRYPIRKFAVYGVHMGVLIVALGALISFIWGFRGIMAIPQSQASNTVVLRDSYRKLPFMVDNTHFSINFYKDKDIPSQYKTLGYIINDKGQKTLFETTVNHPFVYKGIWFYQASYQLDSSNSYIVLNIDGSDNRLYLHKPRSIDDAQFYLANLSYYNSKPIALLYVELPDGQASGWIKRGDSATLGNITINFKDAKENYITVLSVSLDPGSRVVAIGFIIMMLSLLPIFLKFRRRVYKIEIQ